MNQTNISNVATATFEPKRAGPGLGKVHMVLDPDKPSLEIYIYDGNFGRLDGEQMGKLQRWLSERGFKIG